MGIAEVDGDVGRNAEAFVLRHLEPTVPGQRGHEHVRQAPDLPRQGADHRPRVFAGDFDELHEPRLPLHQRRDMRVLGPCSVMPCLRQISVTGISRFVASFRMPTICSALNREIFMRPKLQAAYAHPAYANTKRALERRYHELPRVNESAAASLAEGLEETLTLHRLDVFPELGVSFKTTNLIESVMSRLEARTHRVTHWRTSDQKVRWCAAALWAMERQFRRVKNYRHLPLLKQALQTKLVLISTAA